MATSLLLLAAAETGWAAIDGVSGPVFNLTAKADYISAADGASIYAWGYANGNGAMQYPGPTMIVNQGDTVTINLSNQLPMPVSVVLPGQQGVAATGGSAGLMTQEAPAMAGGVPGTVSYTFTATHAGTYQYHSGTQPAMQVEMGLLGALIVRPNAANSQKLAYAHAATRFDHEYLFLLTENPAELHRVDLAKLKTPAFLRRLAGGAASLAVRRIQHSQRANRSARFRSTHLRIAVIQPACESIREVPIQPT